VNNRILLVLSGGQDSATCAYWARDKYPDCELHAITFNYGQRHAIELEAAKRVGELVGVDTHEFVDMPDVLAGSSPLTDPHIELEQYEDGNLPGGLEKTFVPGRNALFLVIAANRAYALGITDILTGVCQEDSGGYPDCRQSFITLMEAALREAMAEFPLDERADFHIMTPLMYLTKAESVLLATKMAGCYEALAWTHTAYDGAYPPTGHDHATELRAKGFAEAGYPDPLVVRAWSEGLMSLPETTNYNLVRSKAAQHAAGQSMAAAPRHASTWLRSAGYTFVPGGAA
jgi:7-cyano-7-deazaguanine synthase